MGPKPFVESRPCDTIEHVSHTCCFISTSSPNPRTQRHISLYVNAVPWCSQPVPWGDADERRNQAGGGVPVFSPRGPGTCEGNQVRQAQAVGQDDELHVVQVGTGGERARVQVLQHCPHAALARVRKHHLRGKETEGLREAQLSRRRSSGWETLKAPAFCWLHRTGSHP